MTKMAALTVRRWFWCRLLWLVRRWTRLTTSIFTRCILLLLMVVTNVLLLKTVFLAPVQQHRQHAVVHMERAAVSLFDWNNRFDVRSGHGWHLENANQQWKLVRNSRQILDYRDDDWTGVSGRNRAVNEGDDDDSDMVNRLTQVDDGTRFSGGRLALPPPPTPTNYQRHHQQGANQLATTFTVTNGGTASDGLEIALGYGPLLGLNCTAFANITGVQLVSAGWTKAVYRGRYNKLDIAIKTVNLHGHDMSVCLRQNGMTFWDCYKKSAAKILKEIVLLKDLGHPNILKVLGYCIPDGEPVTRENVGGGISMITELGEPLDIIRLLQSSWEDRLRISVGVTRLIYHLAHSPLGALVMNDFRRQQFVLIDGELKLSDVDDMDLDEPSCSGNDECTIRHEAAELVLPVSCVRGRCEGFNEKQNIYNAGRHFVSFLLPHGAPLTLRPLIEDIVAAFSNVTWDTRQLLDAIEKVNQLFVSGKYLDRTGSSVDISKGYKRIDNSDLPGLFDYRCHLTHSGSGCTMSIFDDEEAMEICNEDALCNAFVITPQTTWTGRRIVHFKSNFTSPTRNEHSTLYVKVS